MATAAPDAPATEETAEKKERKPSTFIIAVRTKGETAWTHLERTFQTITQDDAKRDAARSLVDHEVYGPLIQGDGIELAAVSARGFKPIVVRVEPQPAKLVLKDNK